jgi:hypothetical protein
MEPAMRKSVTYFERIPVQKVKESMATLDSHAIAAPNPARVLQALHCRICRKPVPLETAKTDGEGQAVHEECYVIRVARESAACRTKRTELLS